MQYLQRLITTFTLSLSALLCLANVAMPGVWTSSAGGEFTPLFPGDSTNIDKIQMQSEHIVANIYPGFAVVKGTYYMYNHTTKPVQLNIGYPVNPKQFDNVSNLNIEFTDIYEMQVKIDGSALKNTFERSQIESASKRNGWYTFPALFPPTDTLLIEVYYLLNTSEASYTKGYSSKDVDAFTYVLESGRAWKESIGNGIIEIHFKDGLRPIDVYGMRSNQKYFTNDTAILCTFQNLEPSTDDNLVIWYKKRSAKNDFTVTCTHSSQLYKEIDAVEKYTPSSSKYFKAFVPVKDFPLTFGEIVWTTIIILGIGIVILGPIIIAGIFVHRFFTFLKWRRNRNKNNT